MEIADSAMAPALDGANPTDVATAASAVDAAAAAAATADPPADGAAHAAAVMAATDVAVANMAHDVAVAADAAAAADASAADIAAADIAAAGITVADIAAAVQAAAAAQAALPPADAALGQEAAPYGVPQPPQFEGLAQPLPHPGGLLPDAHMHDEHAGDANTLAQHGGASMQSPGASSSMHATPLASEDSGLHSNFQEDPAASSGMLASMSNPNSQMLTGPAGAVPGEFAAPGGAVPNGQPQLLQDGGNMGPDSLDGGAGGTQDGYGSDDPLEKRVPMLPGSFPAEKQCALCQCVKPVEFFGRKSRTKDNLEGYCRTCSTLRRRFTTKVVRDAMADGSLHTLIATANAQRGQAAAMRARSGGTPVAVGPTPDGTIVLPGAAGTPGDGTAPPGAHMRKCALCAKFKDLEQFGGSAATSSGAKRSLCSKCDRVRRRANNLGLQTAEVKSAFMNGVLASMLGMTQEELDREINGDGNYDGKSSAARRRMCRMCRQIRIPNDIDGVGAGSYCKDCNMIKNRAVVKGLSVSQVIDAFGRGTTKELFGKWYHFMISDTRFDGKRSLLQMEGGPELPPGPDALPGEGGIPFPLTADGAKENAGLGLPPAQRMKLGEPGEGKDSTALDEAAQTLKMLSFSKLGAAGGLQRLSAGKQLQAINITHKTCCLCKGYKELAAFSKDPRKLGGAGSYCAECKRLRGRATKANKEFDTAWLRAALVADELRVRLGPHAASVLDADALPVTLRLSDLRPPKGGPPQAYATPVLHHMPPGVQPGGLGMPHGLPGGMAFPGGLPGAQFTDDGGLHPAGVPFAYHNAAGAGMGLGAHPGMLGQFPGVHLPTPPAGAADRPLELPPDALEGTEEEKMVSRILLKEHMEFVRMLAAVRKAMREPLLTEADRQDAAQSAKAIEAHMEDLRAQITDAFTHPRPAAEQPPATSYPQPGLEQAASYAPAAPPQQPSADGHLMPQPAAADGHLVSQPDFGGAAMHTDPALEHGAAAASYPQAEGEQAPAPEAAPSYPQPAHDAAAAYMTPVSEQAGAASYPQATPDLFSAGAFSQPAPELPLQ